MAYILPIFSNFSLEKYQSIIQNSLDKIDEDTKIINLAYKKFQEKKDLNLLPEAIESFQRLKSIESKLWHNDQNHIALQFQRYIQPYNKMVQEMNFVCPMLTYQDLNNLSTFYLPPVEKLFYGEKDNIIYVNPDASAVSRYGLQILLNTKLYKGHGVARQQFGPHPQTKTEQYYDQFSVIKPDKRWEEDAISACKKWNVDYEPVCERGWFSRLFDSSTTQDEYDTLKDASDKAIKYFQQNYDEWGYETFKMISTDDLIKEGVPLAQATRCDVVRFYYKKKD